MEVHQLRSAKAGQGASPKQEEQELAVTHVAPELQSWQANSFCPAPKKTSPWFIPPLSSMQMLQLVTSSQHGQTGWLQANAWLDICFYQISFSNESLLPLFEV